MLPHFTSRQIGERSTQCNTGENQQKTHHCLNVWRHVKLLCAICFWTEVHSHWIFTPCCTFILHVPKGCYYSASLLLSPVQTKLKGILKSSCGAHSEWLPLQCLLIYSSSVEESTGWIKPTGKCHSPVVKMTLSLHVLRWIQSVLHSPSYLCSLKLVLHVYDFGCAGEGREEELEEKEEGGEGMGQESEQAAICVNKRWVFFYFYF